MYQKHLALKKKLKNQSVSYTPKQLKKYVSQARMEAADIINLVPLLILHDKFGFGKVRLQRYYDHYKEMVEAFNQGYVDLKDIEDVMINDIGLKLHEEE